jgi:DNA-binding NtrC family response regulator
MSHSWPGNIRELQNTIERAAVMCDEGVIETAHLPVNIKNGYVLEEEKGAAETETRLSSIDGQLQKIEKGMIIEALKKTGGVQVKAAKLLGIKEKSLRYRITKLGIDVSSTKQGF